MYPPWYPPLIFSVLSATFKIQGIETSRPPHQDQPEQQRERDTDRARERALPAITRAGERDRSTRAVRGAWGRDRDRDCWRGAGGNLTMPERLSKEDAYELLGLEPEPEKTTEEIKKAYKRKSLATHPDKNRVGLAYACGSYFCSTF